MKPFIFLLSCLLPITLLAQVTNSRSESNFVDFSNGATTTSVSWLNPTEDNKIVKTEQYKIELCIESESPISKVQVFHNFDLVKMEDFKPFIRKSGDCSQMFWKLFTLKEGKNLFKIEINAGQETIMSETRTVSYHPKLHADLVVNNIQFKDDNNNGTIDANEKGQLAYLIKNKGQGDAHNIQLTLAEKNKVKGIQFQKNLTITSLKAGEEKEVLIEVLADNTISAGNVHFTMALNNPANGQVIHAPEYSLTTKELILPPKITWIQPQEKNFDTQKNLFNVQLCIDSDVPIQDVQLIINNRPLIAGVSNFNLALSTDCHYVINQKLTLTEGKNEIKFKIANEGGDSESETRVITYDSPEHSPSLVAHSLTFTDEHGDGRISANETGTLEFTLQNTGQGEAKKMLVEIEDRNNVKGLKFKKKVEIGSLAPSETEQIKITISGTSDLTTTIADFQITTKESRGHDSSPLYISVSTKAKVFAPTSEWVHPIGAKSTTHISPYSIGLCISSISALTKTEIHLNDKLVSSTPDHLQPGQNTCNFQLQHSLQLKEGINTIKVLIANEAGEVTAETRVVEYNSEKRIALVIGNSNYSADMGKLKNPVNDAKAMAKELRGSGFEVLDYYDLNLDEMWEALRKFNEKLEVFGQEGVGLFYYAGHGLQYAGKNYLVPIGSDVKKEFEIPRQTIAAHQALDYMEFAESRMSIVILDACRNNPFRSLTASNRSMNFGSGLAPPEPAKGSYVAYATAPGSVASDGDGDNGLYTQELLKAMRQKGLSIEQVFKQVRKNVYQTSEGNQNPWDSSNITGEFFFKH